MSPREHLVVGVLCALGLSQMLGDALGLERLRALANATTASPAPKVFTAVGGSEPFSARFSLAWIDRDGTPHTLAITPERYARLHGPYNRRNAYGAIVAAGPLLIDHPQLAESFHAVSRHGLCGRAPLLRELGVDPAEVASPITLRYRHRADASPPGLRDAIEVRCP